MLCFALQYHVYLYFYFALLLSQDMEKFGYTFGERVKAEYSVWLFAHQGGVAMSLPRRCGCVPTELV